MSKRRKARKKRQARFLAATRRSNFEPATDLSVAGLEKGSPIIMATKTSKWSARVTETSNAMDLKKNVFKQSDPKKIARSVKSSAAHSNRRKSTPKRSAMSMLSFYINRAGKNLSAAQKNKLERTKKELRKLSE